MNYTVLYDVGTNINDILKTSPKTIQFIAILGFLILGGIYSIFMKPEIRKRAVIATVCLVFGFFMVIYAHVSIRNDVKKIYSLYENQKYDIAEGTTTQFKPYRDHEEVFYVNDVKFTLPVYFPIGYNIKSGDGGYINKNGQHVRITYIEYMDVKYIMRLEMLKEDIPIPDSAEMTEKGQATAPRPDQSQ